MGVMANHWINNQRVECTYPMVNWGNGQHDTFTIVDPVVCADGFYMSVQASVGHYCTPRTYVANGDYDAWEVGFPSRFEPTLEPYSDGSGVYGYVPTEIIEEIIRRHNTLLLTYLP